MHEPLNELRQKVAISMRILAMQGCVRDSLGHVSARLPGTQKMFLRCRGGNERGLLYSDVQQVRSLNFDTQAGDLGDGYMAPHELPIHGEMYKARPEVAAVVHAHPYACVMCSIAGLEFRPIFGAFDAPCLPLAARGVPVYPKSILIDRADLAGDLMNAMGDRDCCLMKGHGITTVGSSVETATLLAIRMENLARMILDVARLGRDVPDIPQDDIDSLRSIIDRGVAAKLPKGEEWIWAQYVQLLEDSVGVPRDFDDAP